MGCGCCNYAGIIMKINFSFDTIYGEFCDALDFENGPVPSETVIEEMKLQRLNNWLEIVTPKDPDIVEQ